MDYRFSKLFLLCALLPQVILGGDHYGDGHHGEHHSHHHTHGHVAHSDQFFQLGSGARAAYRSQPVKIARVVSAAEIPAPQPRSLEPEYSGPPSPYQFAYDTHDEFGTRLHREETGDAQGVKRGSYGYTDAHGLYRTVTYVADADGFRATIKTNEPGTATGAVGSATYEANPVVTESRPAVPASAATVGERLIAAPRPHHAQGFSVHTHHTKS